MSVIKQKWTFLMIAIALFAVAIIFRVPSGEIDYRNSDATWHTLLTIQAYDETPISVHKFLPIVSLGDERDKWISWGATIPDSEGNFYYTSFSPAGYVLPYMFFKLFHLPVAEASLYIFNSFLLVLSACLWTFFVSRFFKQKMVWLVALLTYVYVPEVLHAMGIVYWHQSIFQVTFLVQLISYFYYKEHNNKCARIIFYIISLCNPYIEWTGYVVNAGFVLVEFAVNWKENKWKAVALSGIVVLLTIASMGIFVGHYLLVVDAKNFFAALYDRFMARNVTTQIMISQVISGYLTSFLYVFVLIAVYIIFIFCNGKSIQIKNGWVYFILIFACVENVIMKEHALTYSYDRMKFGFLLSFLACELAAYICSNKEKRNLGYVAVTAVLMGALNLFSYQNDTTYHWKTDVRTGNEILADYITTIYPQSVLASEHVVRGYVNLLYGRGVYEGQSEQTLHSLAQHTDNDNIVLLQTNQQMLCNKARVYDLSENSVTDIQVINDEIQFTTHAIGEQIYTLADFTDENWTNGYSTHAPILLFYYDTLLLNELMTEHYINCNGEKLSIISVEYDTQWIRVTVDRNGKSCMYPAYLSIS